jgi:CDP-4-dehydro-6-deoxyglucose reductase, E1
MIRKIKFIPGKTYIPSSGKVYGKEEIENIINAAKKGWWTEGEFARRFEKEFARLNNVKYVNLVNSGSSANLIAVAALTSDVFGDRKLQKGDEFITSPVAFPTTVNPGILYGLTPVFVDVGKNSLNIDASKIEKAVTKKTKLIILAHTLGMPFDLDKIVKIAKKYRLWLIEDCCDALGSKYDDKPVGTFGDIATYSFYPAHQITMGEGGAVITNNPLIKRSIKQFTNWGRDCWCDTGQDDTCSNRFGWKLGDLPRGYDHKYIFSQIGYNLKLTDFQAAIGCAQLKRLPGFINKRKENYRKIKSIFEKHPEYFSIFKVSEKEDPCWFGFPVMIRDKAPFCRNQLTKYLELHKIGTRNIFSGNLLRHPAYLNIKKRLIGEMDNADSIMNNAFWIGVYPGIGDRQIHYISSVINIFLSELKSK